VNLLTKKVPPAPRNSIGDLFSKGLGIAKQYVLQKMDKATPTEETKEFKEKAKSFETSRIGVEELYTKASGFLQASVTANTSFADFSSTTAKLGSHSKADPKSAAVVQSFVPYALQLQGHNAKFNDTYRDLVVRPLQNLLQNEVKQTVLLLKQLDVDRLDYDARRAKLEKLAEKPGDETEKKSCSGKRK